MQTRSAAVPLSKLWSWEGDGKSRRLKSKSSGPVLDVGEEGAIVQKKAGDKVKTQLWQVVEIKD